MGFDLHIIRKPDNERKKRVAGRNSFCVIMTHIQSLSVINCDKMAGWMDGRITS